ncbi:histone-lysine N-methyltransferase SETMAR [Trichonephila clavata]|uniref:Histone-lysine N-methyltransferase SETMAR n=1 Tax=Trichonephila clavata TaxID=2740835 RepID=A0A8X6KZI9_TRICU|nr:histone-lysine N-methyltransferase SETMAR [Trichonephila clavata]
MVSGLREGGRTSYRPLLNMQASKKEQRRVIRFLTAEGVAGLEMHRRMKAVCSEYSLLHSSVVEWRKRFLEGRELLEDDVRPGQAHRVIITEIIAEVNTLVLNNRRIAEDEIHRLLEGTVDSIERLGQLLLQPGFVVYMTVIIFASCFLVVFCVPRYGSSNVVVYILICSMIVHYL